MRNQDPPDDGVDQEGYVAAWLVQPVADQAARPLPAPAPTVSYTWQDVINAASLVAIRAGADVNSIPITSTEGGVFTPESTSMGGHDRLHTEAEHAARVVSMFRWLEAQSPLTKSVAVNPYPPEQK